MIIEIIQKTYRIIRHRSDTLTKTKKIINQTQDFSQKSVQFLWEIKQDGFQINNLSKYKEWGEQLLTQAEQIADDIATIGDKIHKETNHNHISSIR
jgi:hypothetical protein